MDSPTLTIDLTLPYADVVLKSDGTWAEIPEGARAHQFPERWAVLIEEQRRTASLVLNDDNTYELTPRVQSKLLGRPDLWESGYQDFYAPANLEQVKEILEQSPLIVEHWYLMGGSAPNRIIFDGYDEFVEYIHEHTKPGDALHCWSFEALCRDDNRTAKRKLPDELGRGFKGGPY